jgi:hypothetical protein
MEWKFFLNNKISGKKFIFLSFADNDTAVWDYIYIVAIMIIIINLVTSYYLHVECLQLYT